MKKLTFLFIVFHFLAFSQLDNLQQNTTTKFEKYIAYTNGKQKLYPSVLGGTKVTKTGLAMLSFGVVSQERKPFLLFAKSSQRVATQKFQFDFGDPSSNNLVIDEFDRYFRDSKSPKEFLLIKLSKNTKKDRRYIFKEKGSWKNRIIAATVSFSFTEIEAGYFEVSPDTILEKGEYCFVHQDILTHPNFKEFVFYDFSIE